MFRDLRRRRELRTVIWFDVPKQTDWRIDSSSGAAAAFTAVVRAYPR
jgi:hypothetical protein